MAKTKLWHLTSARISEFVRAPDQFAAFDTLRDRPLEDFGLLVSAEANESDDPIPIRTSALMFRWGREAEAKLCIGVAIKEGLGDTTEQDRGSNVVTTHV